jgi:hypothetical protein
MCVDYRALNRETIKDRYTMPRVEDILERGAQGRVFSKLDLADAFHQIRVRSGDEHLTAFNTPAGTFAFQVMPFGLANAPATFQRVIDEALKDVLGHGVEAYMDDVLIHTDTLPQHLSLLRQVFALLDRAALYIKPAKCQFLQSELDFLGHRLCHRVLLPQPGKMQLLSDWPAPRTVPQLRRFLGFAQFYARFIPHLSLDLAVLSGLLRNHTSWHWDAPHQAAFESIKRRFSRVVSLAVPDHALPFWLHTDASDIAFWSHAFPAAGLEACPPWVHGPQV